MHKEIKSSMGKKASGACMKDEEVLRNMACVHCLMT